MLPPFNRSVITVVALVGCFLTSLSVHAAVAETHLQDLELKTWSVRSSYFLFAAMEGNSTYEDKLKESIAKAETSYAKLENLVESEVEQDLLHDINANWDDFIDTASNHTYKELGYLDSYDAIDLNDDLGELVDTLQDFSGEGDSDPFLALAVRFQQMTSEYIALAASADGGMSTGNDKIRIDFEEAVPEFDKQLKKIQRQFSDDKMTTLSLSKVDKKWQFIRPSMVHFYQDAVPFLINRYSDEIIDILSGLSN